MSEMWPKSPPLFEDLRRQLDVWVNEGGEIAEVARRVRARLTNPHTDYGVLYVEVENMWRYFKGIS